MSQCVPVCPSVSQVPVKRYLLAQSARVPVTGVSGAAGLTVPDDARQRKTKDKQKR